MYWFKELAKSATFQFLRCVTIGDSPITIGSACFSHGSNVGIFCELKLATWTEVKPERKYAIRKRTILKTLHWVIELYKLDSAWRLIFLIFIFPQPVSIAALSRVCQTIHWVAGVPPPPSLEIEIPTWEKNIFTRPLRSPVLCLYCLFSVPQSKCIYCTSLFFFEALWDSFEKQSNSRWFKSSPQVDRMNEQSHCVCNYLNKKSR